MKLFSFTTDSDRYGIGVEISGENYNLSEALSIYQKAKGIRQPIPINFLQVFVETGSCSGEMVRSIFAEPWVQSKIESLRIEGEFQFQLPISRPSKIIGLGRNYKAHARELKHDIPEEPLFFCKSPSALIPHQAQIVIPGWMNERVDHEGELALIIGKECKNVSEKDAMAHIAGYAILNDVTARKMQQQDIANHMPWFRSKSIDTFCPLGPYLIPADEIPDPHKLNISLTVNGEERQKAKTSAMIFKIPKIISFISRFMTLNSGDIIATGTPEGVSPVKDGDVIEISITGLGTLHNTVVKAS